LSAWGGHVKWIWRSPEGISLKNNPASVLLPDLQLCDVPCRFVDQCGLAVIWHISASPLRALTPIFPCGSLFDSPTFPAPSYAR
jgi:hypothetical protein